jgi:hypothetical protein
VNLKITEEAPNTVTFYSEPTGPQGEDSLKLEDLYFATQKKWSELGLTDWHYCYDGYTQVYDPEIERDVDIPRYRFMAKFEPPAMLGVYLQWVLEEWMMEVKKRKVMEALRTAEEDMQETLQEIRES